MPLKVSKLLNMEGDISGVSVEPGVRHGKNRVGHLARKVVL